MNDSNKPAEYLEPALEKKALSLLIQNPDFIESCTLTDEDFHEEGHRVMYGKLREMASEGRVIDTLTVYEALGGTGLSYQAEQISNEFYGSAVHLDDCIKQLRLKRVVREFQLKAQSCKSIDEIESLTDSLRALYTVESVDGVDKLMTDYREVLDKRRARVAPGLITGFDWIDRLAVLSPGTLVTLAARSSIGKSCLAGNLAISAGMFKQKVVFITTEMTAPEMMDRFYAYLTGVELWKFKYAKEGPHYQMAESEFACMKDNFFFVSEPKLSSRFIERAVMKYKPDLVVVDYLQLLSDLDDGRDTKNNLISAVTYRFKQLAMRYGCCVLMLSQVNRQSAGNVNGMPLIHELRDSGSIEQNSDVVLIMNRDSRDSTEGVLHVAKNRNGQAEDMIMLDFKPSIGKFTEKVYKSVTVAPIEKPLLLGAEDQVIEGLNMD